MPKLWLLSDLHLETARYPEAFSPSPSEFDILVAAGDILEDGVPRAFELVHKLAKGKPVIYVMGNHEFWNQEISQTREKAQREAKRLGIHLLDDAATTLLGVHFIGGTLWADSLLAGADMSPDMPTGELIKVSSGSGTHDITVKDEIALHNQTRHFIEQAVARITDGPIAVVTHHAPHPACLPEQYRTGWHAGNSASNLSHLTDSGRIKLWMHGHIHQTHNIARPGGTRILCNAAGPHFSNPLFRDDFVIEI